MNSTTKCRKYRKQETKKMEELDNFENTCMEHKVEKEIPNKNYYTLQI